MLDKGSERERKVSCSQRVLLCSCICCCCCFCCLRVLSSAEQRANTAAQRYEHTNTRLKVIQLMGSSSVEHSPSRVNKFNALASSPSPASNQQGAPVAVPWTLTRLALCLCSCMPHGHAHVCVCVETAKAY